MIKLVIWISLISLLVVVVVHVVRRLRQIVRCPTVVGGHATSVLRGPALVLSLSEVFGHEAFFVNADATHGHATLVVCHRVLVGTVVQRAFEFQIFFLVGGCQVFQWQVHLLGSNAHLDLRLVSIDMRAATFLSLELADHDDDILIEELIAQNPVLINRMPCSVIVSALLALNDVMTLDSHILAADDKDAVRSLEVVSTPEEELVADHALNDALLVKEGTAPVNDFHGVVHLNYVVFAVPEYLVPVDRHLAIDLVVAQVRQEAVLVDDLHHVVLGLDHVAVHFVAFVQDDVADFVVIFLASLLVQVQNVIFALGLHSLPLRIILLLFIQVFGSQVASA